MTRTSALNIAVAEPRRRAFGLRVTPQSNPSVLVIDDEPALLLTLSGLLRSQGFHVEGAKDGRVALQRLQDQRFDVVLTDIFLPEIDGLEIIAAVRRLQPKTYIVAISGGGSCLKPGEALAIAKRLGANAALEKPFAGEHVLKVIKSGVDSASSDKA